MKRHPFARSEFRMKPLSALLIASMLPVSAGAMTINPGGTGQVLLYPYFTVNAHQQTLLTITNTRNEGKAVRVRFREAYNGREVLGFVLYLGSHDTWTGTLFSLSDAALPGAGAALATDDKSCTTPSFTSLPTHLSNGDVYQPFLSYAYQSYNADGGPTDDSRTREGFFEVLEMADISGATLQQVSSGDNPSADCTHVSDLTADSPDFAPPSGGIAGTAAIINAPRGTFFATNATAIDGFTKQILFVPTVELHPDLTDATPSSAGVVTANLLVHGSEVSLNYPVTSDPLTNQSIDAVSALLMASTINTDWDLSPGIGARTDWVLTFPTKHYYVDAQIYTSPEMSNAPFSDAFDVQYGNEDEAADVAAYSREGAYLSSGSIVIEPPPPGVAQPVLGIEVQVLSLLRFGDTVPSASFVLGSNLFAPHYFADPDNPDITVGTADLDFHSDGTHRMRPAQDGSVLQGLPVLAFDAVNYVNANVTAGVLANYAAAFPSRTNLLCPLDQTLTEHCP